MRNVVVLPAPLGPSNPTISPGCSSMLTSRTTTRRLNCFTSPSVRNKA